MRLPVLVVPLVSQRYSCHGCGDCCRDFTVELTAADRARLDAQRWQERLGEPVTVDFRGATFLRQREDGACVFLMENGLCRVHAEFGFDEKPLACRLFPFSFAPGTTTALAGINFACQSVRENRGAALGTHLESLRGFQKVLPEAQRSSVVRLTSKLEATAEEIDALQRVLDGWLARRDVPFEQRVDGLAWIAQQLMAAKLEGVRGHRFAELLQLLVSALPEELQHLPIEPPTARQRSLLRQAVFARTEDPKIPELEKRGRLRTVLSQLMRSRRFARGRGVLPDIGLVWPRGATFEALGRTSPPGASPEMERVDDLATRWMRATILGGRAWGSGFYGWPITEGVAALVLNLAAIGWLARAHAASRVMKASSQTAASAMTAAGTTNWADVAAALGHIDRSAGRARWLGGSAERLRLEYLARDDGLRRLVRSEWFVSKSASDATA